jgi:dihydropteroate synthase
VEILEVEAVFSQVKLLISEYADTVDIGTQSTCHFVTRLSEDEKLQRLIPVLGAIVKDT